MNVELIPNRPAPGWREADAVTLLGWTLVGGMIMAALAVLVVGRRPGRNRAGLLGGMLRAALMAGAVIIVLWFLLLVLVVGPQLQTWSQ